MKEKDCCWPSLSWHSLYLTTEDIPSDVAKLSEPVHGTLHGETELPFYSLNDVMKSIFDNTELNVGCVFTMGNGNPCYFSAVMKQEDSYYFFYPHSRTDCGMRAPDGFESLSSHKNIQILCLFIKHLAASLEEKGRVPFELTRLEPCKPDNDTSSGSEFSGFSELLEGEYTCKLFSS